MEIQNHQQKIEINIKEFLSFVKKIPVVFAPAKESEFTVAFMSDDEIRELNKQFRGKDQTTDVLSFPFEPDDFDIYAEYLGDIAISAEQARKQAEENNLGFETEIKQLILHGVLHLCGYDHETDNGEMNELELELRDKLCIS